MLIHVINPCSNSNPISLPSPIRPPPNHHQTMERLFNPWFLEPEKPPDIEEGMTYLQIFIRRFKLFVVFLFSNALYDYAFIVTFGALVASIPLSEEEIVERSMVVQLSQLLSLIAAVPILMAIVIRLTMLQFLLDNSNEKKRR